MHSPPLPTKEKVYCNIRTFTSSLVYSNWTVPTGRFQGFQLTYPGPQEGVARVSLARLWFANLSPHLSHCLEGTILNHLCFSLRTKSKFPTRRKINGRCSTYKFYKSGSFTTLYKLLEE